MVGPGRLDASLRLEGGLSEFRGVPEPTLFRAATERRSERKPAAVCMQVDQGRVVDEMRASS